MKTEKPKEYIKSISDPEEREAERKECLVMMS